MSENVHEFKSQFNLFWAIGTVLYIGTGVMVVYVGLMFLVDSFITLPYWGKLSFVLISVIILICLTLLPYSQAACRVSSSGLEVLEPNIASPYGTFSGNKSLTDYLFNMFVWMALRDYRVISWGCIKNAYMECSLFTSFLVLEFEAEERKVETCKIPWPLEESDRFKSTVLQLAPSYNPIHRLISEEAIAELIQRACGHRISKR